MDIQQQQFITKAAQQAEQAGHIFPEMAACEAALESAYGTSGLAILANNLFGMKQHTHPIFGTVNLPTKEWLTDEWVTEIGHWVQYPDQASCFLDRMQTLRRLSSTYLHYLAALQAPDANTYVTRVSLTWSTDPKRAAKVIDIYNRYKDELGRV